MLHNHTIVDIFTPSKTTTEGEEMAITLSAKDCAEFNNPKVRASEMNKREYFAGLAMKGMLASDVEGVLDPKDCAQCSVAYADALLAELEK